MSGFSSKFTLYRQSFDYSTSYLNIILLIFYFLSFNLNLSYLIFLLLKREKKIIVILYLILIIKYNNNYIFFFLTNMPKLVAG